MLNGLQNPAANLSLLLVQFKGTVALVVDNGRKTTLVKTFADNPLSQNPRFGCQGTAVVGKRTMITAPLGPGKALFMPRVTRPGYKLSFNVALGFSQASSLLNRFSAQLRITDTRRRLRNGLSRSCTDLTPTCLLDALYP
ncbi:MAG: hypothetical protein R2857_04470 [Vampirovibrionales bacterium]